MPAQHLQGKGKHNPKQNDLFAHAWQAAVHANIPQRR